ncbi:MAG: PLP-dependent aminotransferase family protein [Anaerolineales bacterium]|nr:PLP-dependent aminotransferase family protein [Anaerolineales bacterium]
MATNATCISFNRGIPCVEAFPTSEIQQCAAAVLAADAATVLQYGQSTGYMPLRETIARWYGAGPDEVLVSNGSLQIQEFLSALLLSPGDTVFVEEPTYDRAITIFRRHGANVVGIPLEPDGPDVEFLAAQLQKVRPKFLYLIPDFQNPTGVTTSLSRREEIVHLAEEHEFWIIEDSPYRALRYQGSDLPLMRTLNPDRVLHLSSFAKVLSPGVRIGYLVAPERIVEAVAEIATDTYVTPGLLAQGIAYEFCRRGWLEPNVERLKGIYRPKLEATAAALREYLPGADWVEPEGGFFLGLTLPPPMNVANLRERAEKAGLILSDGRGFFPQGDGERFLRLAFTALSESEIREGISRLARLVSH